MAGPLLWQPYDHLWSSSLAEPLLTSSVPRLPSMPDPFTRSAHQQPTHVGFGHKRSLSLDAAHLVQGSQDIERESRARWSYADQEGGPKQSALERLGFKLHLGDKKTRGTLKSVYSVTETEIIQMDKHLNEEDPNQTASPH